MNDGSYQRELGVALAAVSEAAGLCQSVRQGVTPEMLSKKDRSPVTVADFGSQALACRTIGAAFADDPIIAEEDSAALRSPENRDLLKKVVAHVGDVRAGATEAEMCRWIDSGGATEYSDRFWTLDPIDGTKGFLRGGQYAIALALIIEGEVTVAALGCPNLDGGTIYTAVRHRGAAVCGLSDQTVPKSIRVSPTSDLSAARFCESVESGHSSHDDSARVSTSLGMTAKSIRMDSQCKYAVVAAGEAEIYMRLPTRKDYVERIWDHAAGALVVAEAGGRVSDIAGHSLDFRHGLGLEQNKGVLATNGRLHDRVLSAIQAVVAG